MVLTVITEATGRVMRKSQYNSTDSEFTFGSFFLKTFNLILEYSL